MYVSLGLTRLCFIKKNPLGVLSKGKISVVQKILCGLSTYGLLTFGCPRNLKERIVNKILYPQSLMKII